MTTVGRKADHLRIAAGQDVAHAGGTGFEHIRLRHRALPERDLADRLARDRAAGRAARARR